VFLPVGGGGDVELTRRQLALAAIVLLGGCGDQALVIPCKGMSAAGPLVANAKLLKLDVYGAGVRCAGNTVAPGSAPQQSQTFMKGDKIALDIPPGEHTLVLTTFADAAGLQELGSACVQTELKAGEQFCDDLTVTPGPDIGAPDAAMDMACAGVGCPCSAAPDTCDDGFYCETVTQKCVPGCKTSADCSAGMGSTDGGVPDGGSVAATPFCNMQRHMCVQCLGSGDCPVGKLCSPSGACVLGCDLSQGKTCPVGFTCCSMLCVDTLSDPLNCSACNMPCTGAKNTCCSGACVDVLGDPVHCGNCGTACVNVNGTPGCSSGGCTWACTTGYAHCMTGMNTGCDTSTTTNLNCAGCGNRCDTANSNTPTCDGTRCNYASCKAGQADCSPAAPDTDGCETNLAATSQKVCSNMCVPASSCCSAADCTSPPGPAACYTPSCSGVGGSCSYAQKANSQVCGATCCIGINGTCTAGTCVLTCTAGFADCDGNKANGCETNLAATSQKLCGTTCVPASTCCAAGDCSATPSPAACYTPTCSGVGGSCSYPQKAGSEICGATCCLPINGTCNAGTCTLNCTGGFGDCNGNRTDGCELTLNIPSNCSACGAACDTVHSQGATCNGTRCNYTGCSAGYLQCSRPAPNTGGCCEGNGCCGTAPNQTCQVKHMNGFAGNYFDCFALGVTGNNATYNNQMALDAANSYAGQNGTASDGWTCTIGTDTVNQVCKTAGDGTTGTCTCWNYNATGTEMQFVGYAYQSTGAGTDRGCFCATAINSHNWN
jgi:hypothetical protein